MTPIQLAPLALIGYGLFKLLSKPTTPVVTTSKPPTTTAVKPPVIVKPPVATAVKPFGMQQPSSATAYLTYSGNVAAVQARLNELGANPQLTVDGVSGPLTVAAVKSFQSSRGLEPDGIVGPLTQAALGAGPGEGYATSVIHDVE
jgi:peptidoglycan hydrolase-like protein with peptidoglycan-binding domain